MSPNFAIYRDEDKHLIHIEVDNRIVATLTLADWSKAVSAPRRVKGDHRFDFSRGTP